MRHHDQCYLERQKCKMFAAWLLFETQAAVQMPEHFQTDA